MNTKPKLVVFDWDGTLADTTAPIVAAMRCSFADFGLPEPAAEAVRQLIGRSLPEMLYRLAPDAGEHVREELAETYASHYLNPNNGNMLLFADALPCLNTLKARGFLLAVATGKGRTGLDKALAQTATAHFWDATVCAGEAASKPAPDMIFRLCDELGVSPSETLMVGDTVYDLEMAAHAKAFAVGVATGAHARVQLEACPQLAVFDSLAAIPDFLERLPQA